MGCSTAHQAYKSTSLQQAKKPIAKNTSFFPHQLTAMLEVACIRLSLAFVWIYL